MSTRDTKTSYDPKPLIGIVHINSHLFLFENDFAEEELQALVSIVDTELLKAVERQALDNTYQDDMEMF